MPRIVEAAQNAGGGERIQRVAVIGGRHSHFIDEKSIGLMLSNEAVKVVSRHAETKSGKERICVGDIEDG
jgi:hypothetical protein